MWSSQTKDKKKKKSIKTKKDDPKKSVHNRICAEIFSVHAFLPLTG